MTISTSLFYDRATGAMGRLSARADALNEQLSTGKKLSAPSDDAVAYQRLAGVRQGVADDAAWSGNLKVANGLLAQADSALSAIGDKMIRAQEIATQSANGTYSAADKANMATELDGLIESIVSLASATDTRGQPLFGGADGSPALTKQADGRYALATGAPSAIPIGDGQSVQASETASRLFTAGGKNTLSVLQDLSTALKTGGSIGSALDDLSAAGQQLNAVQGSMGVRGARVDMEQAQLTTAATDREAVRSGLEDTDYTAAISELQKTMTVLQATQASFTKLSSLSLFDYLR